MNFVLLPHVVTKLSAGIALCISDVESWAEVSGIHVPPLCPVPHRGEGVNKVGRMNCKMFVMIMGNSIIVLAEIWWSTISWYESIVTLWHSEDRTSWYILIMKAKKTHYFSTLFWYRTLHVSDRFTVHHQESSTACKAIGFCHTIYADCLLARSGWNLDLASRQSA